jgi:hypothetical protein
MSKSSRRAVVRKLTMMCLIINIRFKYMKCTELILPFSRIDTLNRECQVRGLRDGKVTH